MSNDPMSAKPSKSKKTKLSFGNLALLEWLCERPRNRIYTSHNISQASIASTYLYEMGDPGENGKRKIARPYPSQGMGGTAQNEDLSFEKRFGGRVGKDNYKLSKAGYVRSITSIFHGREEYESFVATLDRDRNPFHYAEQVHFLTDAGIAYWESEGRAELERLRSQVAEQRASADRLVLIGARTKITPSLPKRVLDAVRLGLRLPNMERTVVRPYALARVVKETDSRLYVEDVEYLGRNQGTGHGGAVYGIIEGRAPNLYVSKEHVLRDHASRNLAARAVEMHEEYARDANRVMVETIERIMPFLEESDSRLKQMSAGHDDMMKELLDPDREATTGKDSGQDVPSVPKRRRRA